VETTPVLVEPWHEIQQTIREARKAICWPLLQISKVNLHTNHGQTAKKVRATKYTFLNHLHRAQRCGRTNAGMVLVEV
jgi:hypothetical protein